MSRHRRIIVAVVMIPVLGTGAGYSLRDSGIWNGVDWAFGTSDQLAVVSKASGSSEFGNRESRNRIEADRSAESTSQLDSESTSRSLRHSESGDPASDRNRHGENYRELAAKSSVGSKSQADEKSVDVRHEEQPLAHRAIDTIPLRGMRVDAATPCAFHFYPELYPDKTLRFAVGSSESVVVSVHGPGSGACRIDGQPMEDGRQYTVKNGMTLQSDVGVGVHLRPLKDALLRLPDSNG